MRWVGVSVVVRFLLWLKAFATELETPVPELETVLSLFRNHRLVWSYGTTSLVCQLSDGQIKHKGCVSFPMVIHSIIFLISVSGFSRSFDLGDNWIKCYARHPHGFEILVNFCSNLVRSSINLFTSILGSRLWVGFAHICVNVLVGIRAVLSQRMSHFSSPFPTV